jgi:hypothetical protein
MTAIELLALLTAVLWLTAGVVIGVEQMRAVRAQVEWDGWCGDATALTGSCMVEDCLFCDGPR